MFKKICVGLALVACSGEDSAEYVRNVPGSTTVPPLTQEQDILIGPHEWAPVKEPIDAPEFTGDGGLEEKGYIQHQYHGDSDDHRACYSSRSSAAEDTCYLPKSKNVHLIELYYATPSAPYFFQDFSHKTLNEGWLNVTQFTWVKEEMMRAVRDWNNTAGFNISTQNTTGTQKLYVMVEDPALGGTSIGAGGLVAGFGDHVANASPYIAPNGEKELKLKSASVSTIRINAYKIVDAVWNDCGAGTSFEQNVRRYAYAATTHELLHAFGFNHFYAGIMNPNVDCIYAYGLPFVDIYADAEPFWHALSEFNPTAPVQGVGIREHAPLTAERPNG
jgi:hypothetical protein